MQRQVKVPFEQIRIRLVEGGEKDDPGGIPMPPTDVTLLGSEWTGPQGFPTLWIQWIGRGSLPIWVRRAVFRPLQLTWYWEIAKLQKRSSYKVIQT